MSFDEKWENEQFEKIEYPGESSETSNGHLAVYKMDWATRDAIILNLNEYTELFSSKSDVDNATKERMWKTSTGLYLQLNNLLPTSEDQPNQPSASKATLEFVFSNKKEIMNSLMANLTSINASEETKLQMIENNKRLVAELMKLPVSVNNGVSNALSNGVGNDVSKGTAKDAQLSNDERTRLTESSEVADQIAKLNEANEEQEWLIDYQREAISEQEGKINQQEKKISEQAEKINEQEVKISEQEVKINKQEGNIIALNAELNKLRAESAGDDVKTLVRLADAGKVDIGLKRQSAVYEFSISMTALMGSDKPQMSGLFFCDDLAWSVDVQKKKFGTKSYLSVYLRATNFANESSNWSTKTAFTITLLNSHPLFNVTRGHMMFWGPEFSNHSPCWGYNDMITIDKLRTVSLLGSSFIQNGEIKLRVDLQAKKSVPTVSTSSKLAWALLVTVLVVVGVRRL